MLAKSTRNSISADGSQVVGMKRVVIVLKWLQENTNSNTTHRLERATNVGIMFDDNSSSLPSVSDIYGE